MDDRYFGRMTEASGYESDWSRMSAKEAILNVLALITISALVGIGAATVMQEMPTAGAASANATASSPSPAASSPGA